ncbi:MAG: NADPH-dependent assimilatory sulfite reductase hemoprotein subunit [Gemmataceae bacterium]
MTSPAQANPRVETKEQPAAKLSPVEGFKEQSRQLRGQIAETLAGDADHFEEAEKQLLKFHGTYQQEDRDARKNRSKQGVGKHYMFMVRCRIPGGRLTPQQYLAVDKLADSCANGTLRLTTRQGIQFHGVLKQNLKATIAGINECLLSTLGACGDVERNVMACPAPHHHDGVHADLQKVAAELAAHLAPRTTAYHEIWLNGKKIDSADKNAASDVEPLYGKVYLPRKFKTGLALPEDNCIDIYAQDLGLLAIVEAGTIVGYNVLVGGGMGMTHGNAETFPHLAQPICYVPASAVLNAAEAVVRLFRDHGNRGNRKRARIKYIVHDWGVEKFREVLAGYLGATPLPPRPIDATRFDPHLGWQPQGDGKYFYGLSVEYGRIKDEGSFRLRTALRTLIEKYQCEVRITPIQDILLCNLDEGAKAQIDKTLAKHGVKRPDELSMVQKHSMACPAIPTCGLAITESERALPDLIDQLEVELAKLGLEKEALSVRMTGCPNGCARPYQSDIGLVGRSGDKYTLFVGGNVAGTQLSFTLRDLVPFAQIVPTLVPLLERFKKERWPEEGFGPWCQRVGLEALEKLLPEAAGKPAHASRLPAAKSEHDAANGTNGSANGDSKLASDPAASRAPALSAPETQRVGLELAPPHVSSVAGHPESETFLAGPAGEERRDYSILFNSDGTVGSTVIYYYGDDRRASAAGTNDPLRREAAYLGRVHPYRLHSSRKLSDTFYVGSPGREAAERRLEYHTDGSIAHTVLFTYEGDVPAQEAPSGAALRRETTFPGKI